MTMTQRRKNTEGLSMPLLVCLYEGVVGGGCVLLPQSHFTGCNSLQRCVHDIPLRMKTLLKGNSKNGKYFSYMLMTSQLACALIRS